MKWQPYAKAIVGFLTPVVVALGATAADGWTTGELLTALGAGLATLGTVFVTPNRDPAAEHQAESVQPPDLEVVPAAQATSDTKADAAGVKAGS